MGTHGEAPDQWSTCARSGHIHECHGGHAPRKDRVGGWKKEEADPGAWHPAFSPGGDLLLGHGGKRAVGGKGAKRARPKEGEHEEAELGETGSS